MNTFTSALTKHIELTIFAILILVFIALCQFLKHKYGTFADTLLFSYHNAPKNLLHYNSGAALHNPVSTGPIASPILSSKLFAFTYLFFVHLTFNVRWLADHTKQKRSLVHLYPDHLPLDHFQNASTREIEGSSAFPQRNIVSKTTEFRSIHEVPLEGKSIKKFNHIILAR